MTPVFLLYAANLHVGGGVQVATSVIDQISLSPNVASQIRLIVSSEVDSNLKAIKTRIDRFRCYVVENHFGFSAIFKSMRPMLGDAQAIFIVFGPLYQLRLGIPSIVGFAQPWLIYPNNEIYSEMPLLVKIKTRLKYALQSFFFRQAEMLVVELEHVRLGLVRSGIAKRNRICVVRNCLSSLYRNPDRWHQSPNLGSVKGLKLGFLGRNYPHKNTAIFPKLREALLRRHNLAATIYVTFSSDEWGACTPEFRSSVVNVGPLVVAQCPSFYQQLDGVLFPSLLECFSATPLEAMAMKRPLFASDRPFNRDICEEHAFYFDPLNPDSAADAVAACFSDPIRTKEKVERAYQFVLATSGPDVRAKLYLECVENVVSNNSFLHSA